MNSSLKSFLYHIFKLPPIAGIAVKGCTALRYDERTTLIEVRREQDGRRYEICVIPRGIELLGMETLEGIHIKGLEVLRKIERPELASGAESHLTDALQVVGTPGLEGCQIRTVKEGMTANRIDGIGNFRINQRSTVVKSVIADTLQGQRQQDGIQSRRAFKEPIRKDILAIFIPFGKSVCWILTVNSLHTAQVKSLMSSGHLLPI